MNTFLAVIDASLSSTFVIQQVYLMTRILIILTFNECITHTRVAQENKIAATTVFRQNLRMLHSKYM